MLYVRPRQVILDIFFVAFTAYGSHLVLHVNQHMHAKRVGMRSCTQVSKQQQQQQLLAHTVKYLICFRHPPGAALKVELFVVIIVVMFVLYSRWRLSDSIGVHRERRSTRRPKCSLTPFVPQGTHNVDTGEGKRKADSHRTDDFSSGRIWKRIKANRKTHLWIMDSSPACESITQGHTFAYASLKPPNSKMKQCNIVVIGHLINLPKNVILE